MLREQKQCDRAVASQFLADQLTADEQQAFEQHLESCPTCRDELAAAAAEGELWEEVRETLGSRSGLGEPSSVSHWLGEKASEDGQQPPRCDAVLELLGPTDHPNMLGRFGGYEIAGVIGRGGMGVVLKGFDAALNRFVAIKVLAPHLAASCAARKRFSREAQAAAAVFHDNVIAIHSVAEDNGHPYLVMPYERGRSLQKRLDEAGPLSVVEVLRIGMQAASGLAAAHAQGLVHRDVKPANIMLDDGVERVKLTDFGLARAADDASLTNSGAIAGTPQYMSPEQARGDSVDQRSDLFSLGSVLYTMCTGRPPFRAETSYGILRRITDREPRPIRDINPDIPEWLCSIIAKLMAKEPEGRFDSAAEVAELLEECLAHVQQPTTVPLPKSVTQLPPLLRPANAPKQERLSLPFYKRLRTIITIAACAFGMLGMLLWQATDPPDISGRWRGDDWGQVVLEEQTPGKYEGTYTDTFGNEPGSLEFKWSRIEQRFKGTWREGKDRFGKLSVRLVDGEIRGAWTTNNKSQIKPGMPELADLLWLRSNRDAVAAKATTPKRIHRFETKLLGMSLKIAYSADGKRIAIGGQYLLPVHPPGQPKPKARAAVELLDAETGESFHLLIVDDVGENFWDDIDVEVSALAFSPDGELLAVGTNIGQIKLFDAGTGDLVRSLDREEAKLADKKTPEGWNSLRRAMGSVASLAFSPDGKLLATCGESFSSFAERFDPEVREGFRSTGSGRLKVWNVENGTLKHEVKGHESHANAVALSPDARLLACVWNGHNDGKFGNSVFILNPYTGKKVRTLSIDANGGASSLASSPDSESLVIGTYRFDESGKDRSNYK